jgi:DNA invertase Pin-like site-specific DNA recombinase
MSTRAAIYARISHDPTGKELGVQRQLEACRQYAASHGMTVVAEYVENDTSAYREARPHFNEMLASIGGFDAIIVWAVDRLYRRLADLERLVDVLGGTPVHAVMSGDIDLSTADGRLTARLLGSVAAHESEKKAERQKASLQQAIASGRWVGPAPRGYVRTGGTLIPDPVWAPKVTAAVVRVLSGGSVNGVATEWQCPASSVRKLMKSPSLAGLTSRHERGNWEPLIEEADWWRLQNLLNDRQRPDKHMPRVNTTMLGGVARCPHGAPLRANQDGYRVDPTRCRECRSSIAKHLLDAEVEKWILHRLGEPDVADAFKVPERTADFKRIEQLKARRGALASMVADGLLPEDDARRQLGDIKDELAQLEGASRPAVEIPNGDPATVEAVWKRLDVNERRRLVRLLCEVTVLPVGRRTKDTERVVIDKRPLAAR